MTVKPHDDRFWDSDINVYKSVEEAKAAQARRRAAVDKRIKEGSKKVAAASSRD